MSDNPNALKAVLLEVASTEAKAAFATMLAEACAVADRQTAGHICWSFVPTPAEYERMKQFAMPPNYDKCPKCGKGRIVLEIYHGNIGPSLHLVCRWGNGCDYKEYISED